MLSKNLGTVDRTFRIVLGLVLITYGVLTMGTLGIVVGVIGLIPLTTGLVGNCPLYSVFKVNNCKTSDIDNSCNWEGGVKPTSE